MDSMLESLSFAIEIVASGAREPKRRIWQIDRHATAFRKTHRHFVGSTGVARKGSTTQPRRTDSDRQPPFVGRRFVG